MSTTNARRTSAGRRGWRSRAVGTGLAAALVAAICIAGSDSMVAADWREPGTFDDRQRALFLLWGVRHSGVAPLVDPTAAPDANATLEPGSSSVGGKQAGSDASA